MPQGRLARARGSEEPVTTVFPSLHTPSRLRPAGCVGDAGCEWSHAADPKGAWTAALPAPPLQAVEAGAGAQSDQHPGPQPPPAPSQRAAPQPSGPYPGILPAGSVDG